MMDAKCIITMIMPTRPDLTYYYVGQSREGNPIFHLTKSSAKRYNLLEEADRDLRLLTAVHQDKSTQFKIDFMRCRFKK